jgi:hypothetical protein
MSAYDSYFSGAMIDAEITDEAIMESLKSLPKIK